MLDTTIKVEVAIPNTHSLHSNITNTHSLHSNITDSLQKHADLKKQLARIWQLKAVYIIQLVLSTMGIIADYTKV